MFLLADKHRTNSSVLPTPDARESTIAPNADASTLVRHHTGSITTPYHRRDNKPRNSQRFKCFVRLFLLGSVAKSPSVLRIWRRSHSSRHRTGNFLPFGWGISKRWGAVRRCSRRRARRISSVLHRHGRTCQTSVSRSKKRRGPSL